ncbi:MAG: DUF1152 domain-containing protein [Clostridia bacterium]|nr:DUF1152 domain-containing protein [Clostridia bacterium]
MLIPLEFNKESNILLAGAGGGFDFLCALPLALKLMNEGHNVFFANYSFTSLLKVGNSLWVSDEILEVTYESFIEDTEYFPELYLSKWFKEVKGINMPIYCFPRIGVRPLLRAYDFLKAHLKIDEVLIVDGGVDGIFRGDEYDLGTPSMDSISIIAASLSSIEKKYYIFTAFGSEGVNKEVSHGEALERVSGLIKNDKFYGVSSLLKNTAIGKTFLDAVYYIFERMPSKHHSNIVGSIVKAMEGSFGDTAVNEKTAANPIWVSAFTNMFWYFELEAVAKMKLFYEEVLGSNTVEEVSNSIDNIHLAFGKSIRMDIPI